MRKCTNTLFAILCVLVLCLGLPTCIFAAETEDTTSSRVSYNEETGYEIYIDDWADLLTPAEEKDLLAIMEPITAYGNVAFVSIDYNAYHSVESYAENYGYSHFRNESYTLFVIDMDYRKVCVYSDGAIYDTITKAYANTITDNIYSYASDAEYYECAYHAFDQINTLLEGRTIAQPMKYISNALLAVVLALLINYFLVMFTSRSKKVHDRQLLDGIYTKVDINNPTIQFLHQSRRYSPQSSGGGGGHRGGGGGGHSGGGGGGGGSHSF